MIKMRMFICFVCFSFFLTLSKVTQQMLFFSLCLSRLLFNYIIRVFSHLSPLHIAPLNTNDYENSHEMRCYGLFSVRLYGQYSNIRENGQYEKQYTRKKNKEKKKKLNQIGILRLWANIHNRRFIAGRCVLFRSTFFFSRCFSFILSFSVLYSETKCSKT